jgi:uncharacterized protein YlxW (UPF0749 family)
MGRYEMIVAIVAIVMFASVLRARFASRGRGDGLDSAPAEQAETVRLREEVKDLKERIKVLERITVEKENSLSKQIEELRDR